MKAKVQASPQCPQADLWQQLLEGTGSAQLRAELSGHLESCPSCQQTLEELAADRNAWDGVARVLGNTEKAAEPALREVMAKLKGEEADQPATVSLDFLSPTDRPGVLGRIGNYDVVEVIGQGGMGVVLKAFDPGLHRVMAIKVMAPQLASSASARRRFTREAQAAAAVSHDHVITIYAVEEINGLPYLVMQYVPGLSLQEKVDRTGPLELRETLRIGMQAASGLAAAHAQGLIHRDITPANILLENGVQRVKITDFGLARTIDDASCTTNGVVAGTPPYMSPEQARGEVLDHRTDLFSLGSVLYAMCTGRAPFHASTVLGVLRRVSEDEPPAIRSINPEAPVWLEAIVRKLHVKNPAVRFQSATEVADLLGRCLAHVQQPGVVPVPLVSSVAAGSSSAACSAGEPPVATSVDPRSSATRSRRRFLAIAAVVLVGVFGLSESVGFTQIVQAAAVALRIKTPDGTLIVEVDDPQVKVHVDGDEVVILGAGTQEVRLKPGVHSLTVSKDGKPVQTELITITRGGKQVVKVSLEATRAPNRAKAPQEGGLPSVCVTAWTKGKNCQACHQNAWWQPMQPGIERWQAGPGPADHWPSPQPVIVTPLRLLSGHTGPIRSVVFAPDGKRAVSGSGWPRGDGTVRLWDVASGKEVRRFQADDPLPVTRAGPNERAGEVYAVAIAPDGKRIASAGVNGVVIVWDARTGNEVRRLTGHTATIYCLAFSPDGKHLLGAGRDKLVRLWDVTTGKQVHQFAGHTEAVRDVSFAPDGTTFVSAGEDRCVRMWDVRTGRKLRSYGDFPEEVESVAVSLDGKRIVAAGEIVRVLDLETGKEVLRLDHLLATRAVWLPDSRAFLTAGKDRLIRQWDTNGQELHRFTGHTEWITALAASVDGRLILSGGGVVAGEQGPLPGEDFALRLWQTSPNK
jgi:eukaryotic-like serine/threonine-protein kinase